MIFRVYACYICFKRSVMAVKEMKERQMQSKATLANIELKEDGQSSDILHIRAYALAFGNVDSWGDIIAEGAVDDFLKSEDYSRMALCYQHDMREVIGVITDAGVDEKGMWIEADVLPTTTGKDVQTLIRAGAVKEFSIGYYADEYHFEKRDGFMQEIRILDRITIVEVSPVTRAANEKAVLIDAKNDNQGEPVKEDKKENPINEESMEKEIMEMKQSAEAAQKALEATQAELKSAKEVAEKQATEINNLDESVKAQQKTIDELRKMISEAPKTYRKAMRDALETKKAEIAEFIKDGKGSFTVEFKLGTTSLTPAGNNFVSYGVQQDQTIHAVPVLGNAFLLAFGTKAMDGARIAWVEASTTKNVGYVEELAENANKSEVAFIEKQRRAAKIATYMEISSEVENWFEALYDFCVNEGERLIMSDLDGKVWNGDGSDASNPTHIYGVKSAATAFAKLGTYANAHEGDVIMDAVAQIRKAGFAANVAIVSYATEATLKGLKDASGNYIYDKAKAAIGQVTIVPSDKLGDGEMLIADTSCVEIFLANFYELEFSRKASHDALRVDFRRRGQVKVAGPKAKGLVYVANKATAIEAINA